MDLEKELLQILQSVLEQDSIDENCSQDTCEQWDSLRQLNIAFELEERFDIQLFPEEIAGLKSFNEILLLLKAKL